MSNKKPKGRMSAYTFFVQTCRDEHRRWYPDENVNFTEFSKKCSARWKLMTEEQKLRFVEMSNGDKHRYETEMASYNPPSGEVRKRKKRDPLAPKRPLSAFFLFCQEERPKVREQHPSASVSEIAKIMGEKWSKIDPDRKKAYEEEAIRAKAQYDREAAIYRENTQQQQQQAVAATTSVAAKRPIAANQQMAAAGSHQNATVIDYRQQQMARAAAAYQQQLMMLNNAGNAGHQMLGNMGAADRMYHSAPQQMIPTHHHMMTSAAGVQSPQQNAQQMQAQQYIGCDELQNQSVMPSSSVG